MAVIDLTRPLEKNDLKETSYEVETDKWKLKSPGTEYTGVVYTIQLGSMVGSYVDLPGHIAETDDGKDGMNTPIQDYYRVPARVIRFNLPSGHGGVTAADLEKACGGKVDTPALIINALGEQHQHSLGFDTRSVYLTLDAVQWIADCGVKIILSDIYESKSLDGVFLLFSKRGVHTICCGRNMHLLTGDKVLLTALFMPLPGVTQLPCRLLAETMD